MLYLPEKLPSARLFPATPFPLHGWRQVKGVPRVLLLNLMPEKEVTERDICRTLAATRLPLQVIPLKIKGQTYKTTPQAHMDACYIDFDEVEAFRFERLILTGAPLEQMPFGQVRYWPQLCHIMDWADKNVERTLYICWGAQAGLYHRYGIPKHPLAEKCFGIFTQRTSAAPSPLTAGLRPAFPMPNSRHTEVRRTDIAPHESEGLHILAESEESGIGITATEDCRHTYIIGHLEYDPMTLDREYRRDLAKHLPIHAPEHYYAADGTVAYSWKEAAIRFYTNWLQ